MTANGIYDTKTQTQSFGESHDYMKFIASKSNLDRFSNVFSLVYLYLLFNHKINNFFYFFKIRH
jgi:hypothetical protein